MSNMQLFYLYYFTLLSKRLELMNLRNGHLVQTVPGQLSCVCYLGRKGYITWPVGLFILTFPMPFFPWEKDILSDLIVATQLFGEEISPMHVHMLALCYNINVTIEKHFSQLSFETFVYLRHSAFGASFEILAPCKV